MTDPWESWAAQVALYASGPGYQHVQPVSPRRMGKTIVHEQIEMIWSEEEDGSVAWDPSITITEAHERQADSIRLNQNLKDALARNGYWWDRRGIVHKAGQ